MKKYLVFQWFEWEAGGGWNDLIGQADTIEEARALRGEPRKYNHQVGHIIDTQTGEIVEEYEFKPQIIQSA